ncbi:MAG: hypothetical protein ACM3JD_02400, partial [Rudaea sp.]
WWPYPVQIRSSLYNWSDALLNSWTLAWTVHALFTDPLHLYNANIFYPFSNALAYSESLFPQAALAVPIILSTGLPSLAHNLLALLSFVVGGFGMYLLVFDLTRSRAGGLVAGMIFTFTSYKLMHLAHLQLLSSEWMPFALLYLHRLLAPLSDPAGRVRWREALLFAIFFWFQALSSFYYAFMIGIAAGLYVVYTFAAAAVRKNGRSAGRRRLMLRTLLALAGAAVLIGVTTLPFVLPYLAVQRDLGLQRGLQDAEYYAATLRTYFSVPDGNWLYHRWLAPRARLTGSGERDFVGLTALLLGVLGLVVRPRRDREKYFYLLLAAVGMVLSFGARNEIVLFNRTQHISLPFYLPYRYLFEWIPGFKAMRGPDRFAYLAILGLAVLAGYAAPVVVARVRRMLPRVAWAGPAAALALAGLIGIENLAIPVRATNPATLLRPAPAYARFLSTAPAPGGVLEIPMYYQGESLAWPQYYSIYHWRTLVNGFSGFFPPAYRAVAALSQEFPDEKSKAVLSEIGVRYVVVHNDLLTPAEREGYRTRIESRRGEISLAVHAGNDDVYELSESGQAWAAELAARIPDGASVWLHNSREDRRLLFELAAPFLSGRTLYGDSSAALHSLPEVEESTAVQFVVANADEPVEDFNRLVWRNEYLAVYSR